MNPTKFNRAMAGIQRYVELKVITLNPSEKSATIQAEILEGKSDDYIANVAKNIAAYIFQFVHAGKSIKKMDEEKANFELTLYTHDERLIATVKGNEVKISSNE